MRHHHDVGPVDAEMQRAILLFQKRQFEASASACSMLQRRLPRHFDALRLLGIAQLQLDRPAHAIECFDRALLQRPDAETLFNRANALQRLSRTEEAVTSYDAALRLREDFAECWNNRGIALLELKRFEAALASCDAALAHRPQYPRALNNRGMALLRSKRWNEASTTFKRALDLQADYAAAWSNLSMALCCLRRFPEARTAAERALALEPKSPSALTSRAMMWLECEQYREAASDSRCALEIDPRSALALSIQAAALARLGMTEQALEVFTRRVAIHSELDFAVGDLLYARLSCAEWTHSSDLSARLEQLIGARRCAIRPLHLLSVSDSAADQLVCASAFAELIFTSNAAPLWRGERYSHRKIRLAYVSPDFREHPVSYLMAGIFEEHDTAHFETVAISLRPEDGSDMGQRVKRAFGEFVPAHDLGDLEVASAIREREIDIVIDLKGYTDSDRGFLAFRPAPVQVNYLGFPGTLGSPCHDYIIADAFVVPAAMRQHYSEKVVYLPECFQANDGRRSDAGPTLRRNHGLPEECFVFAAFNNCHKVAPAVFAVWMRLLHAIPGSILWMLAESSFARENLVRAAATDGIEAHRLIFAERQPYASHLSRLALADLFLDTLPFNGGTTVSDALWAGLPVVTCAGRSFASRMAGSLLQAYGLPDLVTTGLQEYEALARSLALDRARLLRVRNRLALNRNTTPVTNTARFCRHLEAAYAAMAGRIERGAAPDHLEIPPLPQSVSLDSRW